MPTAWTTWSGCDGHGDSCARTAAVAEAGGSVTAASCAPPVAAGPRRPPARSSARRRPRWRPAALEGRGHALRQAADPADCLVRGVLVVRHGQGRDLGAGPAKGAGD